MVPKVTVQKECDVRCTATPECAVCGLRKKLRGRSYPPGMANGYCDHECTGYNQEPLSGHLWPREWRDHVAGDHSGCMHD